MSSSVSRCGFERRAPTLALLSSRGGVIAVLVMVVLLTGQDGSKPERVVARELVIVGQGGRRVSVSAGGEGGEVTLCRGDGTLAACLRGDSLVFYDAKERAMSRVGPEGIQLLDSNGVVRAELTKTFDLASSLVLRDATGDPVVQVATSDSGECGIWLRHAEGAISLQPSARDGPSDRRPRVVLEAPASGRTLVLEGGSVGALLLLDQEGRVIERSW